MGWTIEYSAARIAANPVQNWRFLYTLAGLRLDAAMQLIGESCISLRTAPKRARRTNSGSRGRDPSQRQSAQKRLRRTSSRREFRARSVVPFGPSQSVRHIRFRERLLVDPALVHDFSAIRPVQAVHQ